MRLIKDGTEASPTNSPSEVDSTNCPGLYSLLLTSAETSHNVVVLAGKSSTANVILVGAQISFELLPTTAPGSAGGLPELPLSVSVSVVSGASTGPASPVQSNSSVFLERGQSYLLADNNTLAWSFPASSAVGNLTTASSIALYDVAAGSNITTQTAVVTGTYGSTAQTVTIDMTSAQVSALNPGTRPYQLIATLASGSVQIVAQGQLVVG